MKAEKPIDPLSSAAAHAELGLPLSDASLPKRVVVRLTRFFVERQRAYNRGVVDALRVLADADRRLEHRVQVWEEADDAVTAGLRSELTRLELAVADADTVAGLTRVQVVELARAVQHLERRTAELDAALADLRSQQAAQQRHGPARETT
jgi:predicted kinase